MQQGATMPPQPVAPPDLHRVKLYKLNETGGWDDKGTGEAASQKAGAAPDCSRGPHS